MFLPLSFCIGLRYTCSKRRNHFISFISLISVLGIALGVTVLITSLSVMNGFDYEIHNRIFSMAEHVKISGIDGGLSDWHGLEQEVVKVSRVVAAAPYIAGQGMANNSGTVSGVVVNGILPQQEKGVSAIDDVMKQGSMADLKPGSFGVIIGLELAMRLGVGMGDKLMLITPRAVSSPVGVLPVHKRFTVVGIFNVGGGFGYDSGVVFIHLNDAQKLFQMGNDVSGLRLRVQSLYDAPAVTSELERTLSPDYLVTNWTREYGAYFKAIKMEKTMIFILLMFIIAVASFNLVSSLVMTVNDKRSDIAILRTLGASPATIMSIFMVQGSVIGLVGTLAGIVGGVLLALNAPVLVVALEHLLNVNFISSSVYFIDHLPSRLMLEDVVRVGGFAFVMSLLATIYPAWRAAKTQPAEALRYE
jgi:lipoprotein-releasing system permease protein